MTYTYKTKPLPHQRKTFQETANKTGYAWFWDPGLGKSKAAIDTFAYLFQQGKCDAVVIVAPNGVQLNWLTDEIPKHCPDSVQAAIMAVMWDCTKFNNTEKFKNRIRKLLKHDGLAVLVANYESTITDGFKSVCKKFLDTRKGFMVLDESHRIKTPDSKVKISLTALGQHAKYRRICTGTPMEKPFDIYAQIRFLDPDFWKSKGFETFTAFQKHFGVYRARRWGGSFGRFDLGELVDYKNIDELSGYVHEVGWRLTKDDAGLNLPPKVYSKWYAEMLPEQWRVYNELRDKCKTQLLSGDKLEVTNTMTKFLRLQQIVCGFVACEKEQPEQYIVPGKNPRMEMAVEDILKPLTRPAIVFSRFTKDIDELCARLGKEAVRYDGEVSPADRARAKLAFQSGDAKYFVSSKAGKEGLTLVQAETVLYYSNLFELIMRLQSEDRAHRIGQDKSVNYIDIVTPGTIDEYIIGALRDKFDIVNQITKDHVKAWL